MRSNKQILLLTLCLVYLVFYSGRYGDRTGLSKPLTNDHYNFIAVNEIKMWVSNNGDGSNDPNTGGNGFYWPGGINARDAAIFEDGLLWGGVIDSQIRVNGNTHFQGLQAGKILSPGVADNPALPKYRVYKIRKNWEDHPVKEERLAYEKDYNEWPVEDGAPWVDVDGDGIFTWGIDQPEFVGDEVLWYVSNDLDLYRSRGTYGSDPIGLEIQTIIWGYNKKFYLGNVVFKKYIIINKSLSAIDRMYFAYWSDIDLGNANDDYSGCDTLINLNYCYNGDNEDGDGAGIQYGLNPPAVGHMFVQGPIVPGQPSDRAKYKNKWLSGYKNLPMTAFMVYIGPNTTYKDPAVRVYQGTLELYNNMLGFVWNGNPFIDPHTSMPTKLCIPGDPVTGEGWYEGAGWPGGEDDGDRRQLMSTGPVTMAPGDTQEVVIALLIARGDDHIDSITELKKTARSVQVAYDHDFNTTPILDKPELKSVKDDKSVTLYWDLNIENFDVTDPVLEVNDFDDKTYSFEGYRVWQFRDLAGTDPRVIATYDIPNDVNVIYDWQIVDGSYAFVAAVKGENSGIRRSHLITKSVFDEKPLNNANPYYFAVTAYAYSKHSDPTYVESEPEIIEVIPGLQRIDQNSIYEKDDNILADHISGNGDGEVELIIVDPNALTGDEYRVAFQGDDIFNAYTFINYTQNDTIIADCTDYGIDTVAAVIMDGFVLNIYNKFIDLHFKPGNYRESSFIKNVLEMAGPGGSYLESPVDVFENLNSSVDWEITSYWEVPDESLIQNIDLADGAGFHNYEVRFTSGGSQYYLAGSARAFTPWRGRDPLAADRVPFEVWDVGSTDSPDDDVRLTIKILDEFKINQEDSLLVKTDSTWSQLENGDWEPIYAFFDDSVYSEPLVDPSGVISPESRFKVGKIIIRGNLPEEGTVIQISTMKPLSFGDVFSVIATAPNTEDYAAAKTNLDDISVFPNPFFGTALYSGYNEQSFVRFTNLPTEVTLRIFSIGGTYVRRIDKNDDNPYMDWDLKNNAGETVASGVYIAHLEMPNIGEKVLKVAVILENRQ